MSDENRVKSYRRPVTPLERWYNRSPYSIVTMVARIKGAVSEERLRAAVSKVRERHANLRVRIITADDGTPWFTSDGAQEPEVRSVRRESADHWIRVVAEANQTPFEFDVRPPIRFILVQSPAVSELVISCHHILCDGFSLAYLARDLMQHLGDPAREVELLPDPVTMDAGNIPAGQSLNALYRFVVKRMNKKWAAEKVTFDQADYEALANAYWRRFRHQVLPVELSQAQTSGLVTRCREQEVTVNSALMTAFLGAQALAAITLRSQSRIAVGASLRERLPRPAGEEMGFYAGGITFGFKYDANRGFWDNARQFHRTVRSRLNDKDLFHDPLTWCAMEPTLLEAIPFKMLGGLVAVDHPRHQKLSAFAARDDVVASMLKRENLDSLESIILGTAVTNLGRLDFPSRYGDLELERLLMKAGGAFPLANVNLLVGAVTAAGRLSLVLEHVEESVDRATMEQVRDTALELLQVS